MIFATVGTQKPFPRFADMVAGWARAHPDTPVVLQCGGVCVEAGGNLVVHDRLPIDTFAHMVDEATVVVAHAGIGTILTALAAGVPVVIVPRFASAGEHRNDHQVDTAHALVDREGVFVALDEDELGRAIQQARELQRVPPPEETSELARLTGFVAAFIRGEKLDGEAREIRGARR